LVVSVQALARLASWPEIKHRGAITVTLNGQTTTVNIVAVRNKLGGALRYVTCPTCRRPRCRDLFTHDGHIGCRRCLRAGGRLLFRHEDQLLGTKWEREIVRPARQIDRIKARLEHRGLPRPVRRRLRRRRERLVARLTAALALRQSGMEHELLRVRTEAQ
jgi:hypothetical protein